MITKDNIEAYLLDYVEGALNADQTNQLLQFLAAHPEFNELLNDFEIVAIEPPNSTFENKEKLRSTGVNDAVLVSLMEGQLDAQEAVVVENTIANSKELQREQLLFQSTILKPDSAVVFNNKAGLKKTPVISLVPNYSVLAAAASVAILMLIFWPADQQVYNERRQNLALDNLTDSGAILYPHSPKSLNDKKGKAKSRLIPTIDFGSEPQFAESVDEKNEVETKPADKIGVPSKTEHKETAPAGQLKMNEPNLAEAADTFQSKLPNLEFAQNQTTEVDKPKNNEKPKLAEGALDESLATIPKENTLAESTTVAEYLVDKIDDKTNFTLALNDQSNEDATRYSLKIGGFEFSRKKKK